MKKFLRLLTIFTGLTLLTSCSTKSESGKNTISTSPDKLLISAHTAGEISTLGEIRVQFTGDMVQPAEIDKRLSESPLTFTPLIKGEAIWSNPRTLIFRPKNRLPEGQDYTASVSIASAEDTTGQTMTYTFTFSTVKQAFEIDFQSLKTPNPDQPDQQIISGIVRTADIAELKNIRRILKAHQNGKTLPVEWSQNDDRTEYSFTVTDILRKAKTGVLRVEWNGDAIGVRENGEKTVDVPPLSKFESVEITPVQSFETYVEILFSDPLDRNQDLNGLIRIDNKSDLRFVIDENAVHVYSGSRWAENTRVHVETGIKNIKGESLNKPRMADVTFETLPPQVRFTGQGVILPGSQGLTVPIETVNLRQVMVKATRVFDQNISQFFQINDLKTGHELYRVGRVVWKDVVDLSLPPEKINQWTRYGLDMAPLFRNHEPGLYRLELTFLPPHIIYDCAESNAGITASVSEYLEAWTSGEENETSNWDYWDDSYNYNNYYQNRKNPCHPAFYQDYYDHNITVTKNVLVSDIGLIAKKGENDSLLIIVTNMQTAKPIHDAELTLLDFQQQIMNQGKTNDDGMAFLSTDRKPFLVIARFGGQTGYLKLQDGGALSVSHFDVSGAKITSGIKGFLYGERGVWRPGDDIYLTFILLDESGRLPKNHPVRFQMIDPRGRIATDRTTSESLNGFYKFQTATEPDAPTGNWTARVTVGGASFEKSLKVETIMPNRLKMALDFGGIESLKTGVQSGLLKSEWLHGAPAAGLKADVELGFTQVKTRFNTYPDFNFDDPARDYEPESRFIFEAGLDARGEARFDADIETDALPPGMLTANFKTRVFEPGGAFSVDRFSMPYSPYNEYVGIRAPEGDAARGMLLTDTTHAFQIALLDANGNPVQDGEVEMELYKIQWRWWWQRGSESIADYIGSRSYQPVQKGSVRIKDGRGIWNLKVQYPSWGRYLIRAKDKNGEHTTGVIKYIDWPGWAGRGRKDQAGGANVLAFTADKDEYQVGETATLTIPAGMAGRALLTIESGDRIQQAEWLEVRGEEIRHRFKITPAMAPNIYTYVTLLQPHLKTGNDRPIRMYGITSVRVIDPGTRLAPELQADDVFEPLSAPVVRISEARGRAMTYTLAVVDEGLLGLTRFETPNPWNYFYAKEALGVQTWDLYDDVAGAYAGKLESLLAIGGGEEGEEKGQQKANRFPPMVQFYGPFELGKGKTAKHALEIPQYIGEVRVMVVAGDKGAFGATDKSVKVKKPLMLLGTLPRVLSIGEEVDLPVSVFAMDNKIKEVNITVTATGPVEISGEHKKTLQFQAVGDQLARFKIRANDQAGIARIIMTASGSGERLSQSIEIDVRIPSERISTVMDTLINANEVWEKTVFLPGLAGTNDAMLEISRIPPVNLEKRIRYLILYPHGCIEQTTSSVFPQLYLSRFMDLSEEQQTEIQNNITEGIKRIQTFQNYDGGFSYWPGDLNAHDWSSSYAGHFLLEAEDLGYYVPPKMLNKWREYQRKQACNWSEQQNRADLAQAYRLYTLALSGHPEPGAMNRLKEYGSLSTAARFRLAAAYALTGQTEAADQLIRGSRAIEAYTELSTTYGSATRDMSMILETVVLMDRLDETYELVRDISKNLSDDRWMSTQSTAFALLAIGKYLQKAPQAGSIDVIWSWNGSREIRATSRRPVMQIPLTVDVKTSSHLIVKSAAKGALYPRIIMSGLPAPGMETATKNGIRLNVNYLTLDDTPMDVDNLKQGTDFIAEITVTNIGHRGDYHELALAHLIPAGWEIHNERMDHIVCSGQSAFDYQDIRDDRVYTYFDLRDDTAKTFRVMLNAAYTGRYYLPPVSCEAMYDATIYGRVKGEWIHVTPSAP